MPFKHNAARRHRIPRARYRVTNWPVYEAGLRRRGDLALWLDEAALAGWAAPRRSSPGGQPLYSELAIELVLTLRLVFHLAVDADTGEIAAHLLTDGHADDAAQVPALLGQAEVVIASITADGAYNDEPTYAAAATRQRHPPPDVVVPPRASAVPSSDGSGGGAQSPRDRHIQLMAERGRMGWQRETGYGRRNQAETAMFRHKHLIGPKLRARSLPAQQGEAAIAVAVLNKMIRTAKPVSVRVA